MFTRKDSAHTCSASLVTSTDMLTVSHLTAEYEYWKLVYDVVEKTSTRRRSRIPCVVVEKITTRRREGVGVEKVKKVDELSTKLRVIYLQQ